MIENLHVRAAHTDAYMARRDATAATIARLTAEARDYLASGHNASLAAQHTRDHIEAIRVEIKNHYATGSVRAHTYADIVALEDQWQAEQSAALESFKAADVLQRAIGILLGEAA